MSVSVICQFTCDLTVDRWNLQSKPQSAQSAGPLEFFIFSYLHASGKGVIQIPGRV